MTQPKEEQREMGNERTSDTPPASKPLKRDESAPEYEMSAQEVEFKPGWLERQFECVNDEVAQWPKWMRQAAGFEETTDEQRTK